MNKAARTLTPEQKRKKKEWMKAWYERNKERLKEKFKQKYHQDPGYYKEQSRKWAEANRERVNQRCRGYQKKRYDAMTPEQKQEMVRRRKGYYLKSKQREKIPLTPEQKQKQREYQKRWWTEHSLSPEQKQARTEAARRLRIQKRELRVKQQVITGQDIEQRLKVLKSNYVLPPRGASDEQITLKDQIK